MFMSTAEDEISAVEGREVPTKKGVKRGPLEFPRLGLARGRKHN